jgi:aminoglycoside phosphotransferase (APT) family kinase protein
MEERALVPMPADAALPQLALALDAGAMQSRLAPLVDGRGRLAIDVVKHTPGKRCVIAYRFENGARAIGKMVRKQRAAAHAAALAALEQALAGTTRTPRLLACFDDLGMVLQEWVEGERVPEYADLAGRAALVERLGAALATFHRAPIAVERHADLAAHLRRTCGDGPGEWTDVAASTAARARRLQAAMLQRDAAMARVVRPCHGDFSPRQIFVHADVVTLVDVDGLSLGDPALDVANFRVGLRAYLERDGAVLADRFLAAYAAAGGPALARLDVYEAFAWLRRAVIAWRKRPPEWQAVLERCLERGDDSLRS